MMKAEASALLPPQQDLAAAPSASPSASPSALPRPAEPADGAPSRPRKRAKTVGGGDSGQDEEEEKGRKARGRPRLDNNEKTAADVRSPPPDVYHENQTTLYERESRTTPTPFQSNLLTALSLIFSLAPAHTTSTGSASLSTTQGHCDRSPRAKGKGP